jgi:S1-C subfamily serine protease
MKGDLTSGFISSIYPAQIIIVKDDNPIATFDMPDPDQPLGMVILAEIYVKDNQQRIKISNQGFALGIDSYAQTKSHVEKNIPNRYPPSRALPIEQNPRYTDQYSQPAPGIHSGALIGSGSGVVVGKGLIVTNAHVIENGQKFTIGNDKESATLIAIDFKNDLALLKFESERPFLSLRMANPLWLGENIMAAGYPLTDVLGADLKVTMGNISGLYGSHKDITRFQFSAPIASGSSGGAILDENGLIVGITTASLAHENMRQQGSISENINFGIRSSLVYEMIGASGMEMPKDTGASLSHDRRAVIEKAKMSILSVRVMA